MSDVLRLVARQVVLPSAGDAGAVLARLAHRPDTVLLDSGPFARSASYILVAPTWEWEAAATRDQLPDPRVFDAARARWSQRRLAPDPSWSFRGGLFAFLGYGARRFFERLPERHEVAGTLPDVLFRDYRCVLRVDEPSHRLTLSWLEGEDDERIAETVAELRRTFDTPSSVPLARSDPVAVEEPSRAHHLARVARAREHLLAGDIYQVNLAHVFAAPRPSDPVAFHRALRRRNPARFAAFLRHGNDFLASVSPERFVSVASGRRIEARPIKGTMPRGRGDVEDARAARLLMESPKDDAELAMIVDILRNDLNRVSDVGSVGVPDPKSLESHPTVHHLVARVTARLAAGYDVLDLVARAHPGGSITGAPRVRAMEIIDALEDFRRGPYTGSLGYLGFDGRVDLSILIRTAWSEGDSLRFAAGGGIVIDSDAGAEHRETLAKVGSFLTLLREGW